MQISSTKRTVKSTSREVLPISNAIHAAPNPTNDGDDAFKLLAQGMFVLPAHQTTSDPLSSALLGIAKSLSIHLASHCHPTLGSGVRAGWAIAGACDLLSRAKHEGLAWHEVALGSCALTIESLAAIQPLLPAHLQIDADWSDGIAYLIEATEHAVDGGDLNQFVVGQVLDQSPAAKQLRMLCSLAIASRDLASERATVNDSTTAISFHAANESISVPDTQSVVNDDRDAA